MVNIGVDKFSLKSLREYVRLFLNKEYFNSRIAMRLFFLSGLTNVVSWFVIWFFLRQSRLQIILHYNVYFGVDRTGDYEQAYYLSLIGLILLLVNFWLAFYFYNSKERIAAYVLLLAAFMAQVCLLISIISIIIINY